MLRGLTLVGDSRRKKTLAYTRDLDRRLSVIAGLLLRVATGADEAAVVCAAGGKPQFADQRLPRFNLSHCDKAVACVTATASDVGVDVETYESYNEEVAEAVMDGNEIEAVAGSPQAFAALWTRKESYLKYIGAGLAVDPLTVGAEMAGVEMTTFHADAGYVCTACVAAGSGVVEVITVGKDQLFNCM